MGVGVDDRIDPDTAEIIDVANFEYTRLMEEMTPLPREFNVPWTESDIVRTEVSLLHFVQPVPNKLTSSGRSRRCCCLSYRGK